ncbi:MAG TPA: TonB-dependent receptor plug domain-containing protein, partial [Panacibacter sp.]|nr:TonB-dependent receptor plug domain-containing protein [Panacibacter sp.]
MRKWQLILVNGIVFTVINTSSFSQDICGEVSIDSAEYRYEIGRFDECIQGINNCLQVKAGFNADQKVQAYYLLAKCYLAVDMPENADSAIESLLLLKDNFETDFRDPERFRTAVLVMRSNIISSVSKQNEDIRLAPATTVIITKEEILQRGYTDLIDILKDIPGFDISVYYGQLYANVYQRGLRTNNTEKTLLLVDGVEENDLWSNFADMSQQYPVTNIKRVEIIYGPASTMYGPTAFSGVINIITKDPVDYLKDKKEIAALANTGIGSYNTRYVDISAAARKGIFSYSITGRFYQSDRPDLSKQRLWDFDPAAYDDEIPNYYYKK